MVSCLLSSLTLPLPHWEGSGAPLLPGRYPPSPTTFISGFDSTFPVVGGRFHETHSRRLLVLGDFRSDPCPWSNDGILVIEPLKPTVFSFPSILLFQHSTFLSDCQGFSPSSTLGLISFPCRFSLPLRSSEVSLSYKP